MHSDNNDCSPVLLNHSSGTIAVTSMLLESVVVQYSKNVLFRKKNAHLLWHVPNGTPFPPREMCECKKGVADCPKVRMDLGGEPRLYRLIKGESGADGSILRQ